MLSPSSTIRHLLSEASKKVDRLDAEVLLAHVLKKPREFLISHDTDSIRFLKTWKFRQLVKKRQQNYPAAQLTGTKGFYGYDFIVNKHTLIPRPDTEILVELAVQAIKDEQNQQCTLIDVGTGSGCIPIAVAKQTADRATFFASDISKQALRVAKRNATKHNVNITFTQGNLINPFLKDCSLFIDNCPLILTANLPYLTEHQFQSELSIQHEPKSALVADNEGLALYEELFQQVHTLPPVPCLLLLEIDPTQSERMKQLLLQYFPKAVVEIKKDLAGLDRIVSVTL